MGARQRCTAAQLVEFLRGAKDAKAMRGGLDRLPEHGIGPLREREGEERRGG
jgi:hypothetical protein